MVVSVAKATSADYYTGGGGVAQNAESYYLDAVTEGEPPGQWSGKGAERLGLSGEVDAQDMHTLYSNFINPINGEQVGRKPDQHKPVEERIAAALAAEPDALPERVQEIRTRIERSDRQSVIGWDATFSVPKSVTVAHTAVHRAELAAIRSGDLDRAIEYARIRSGIEAAILEANQAMLGYTEKIATVRTGGGAGTPTQWAAAPGLVFASFFQHTSRNIDPQLHVHNVTLNRAFAEDGKARAIDGQDLLAQKHALGAVADRVLEEALTRLGFEFELRPDGMARELTIVPTQTADLFSSRRRQVSAKVAELLPAAEERAGRELTDLELFRLKQYATVKTRARKGAHAPETPDELIDRWWATSCAIGTDLDDVADAVLQHLNERNQAPGREALDWSPSAVIAESVAALGERRAAWRHSDLMLEIARRLPSLGGLDADSTVELLQRLTDVGVASTLVQQVSGQASGATADAALIAELLGDHGPGGGGTGPNSGQPGRHVADALAEDPFTAPSARLYATADTLAAEEALRRAAIDRGARHLDAADINAWLDQHTPTIGADQRAAVTGIASSDAQLCVLVGPAGTGKSYAAGAFAQAWSDLTAQHPTGSGRVVGLAVSQIATQVLIDDGVADSRNITQWLDTQDRLDDGSTHPGDTAWRLGPADVVMVDEASMVATADLERIQALAQDAGARVVLTGDPRQLGAVEAGGVMGLLDGHAETYTLSDVRRFSTGWEPAASLALRDGDLDALAEYDRHGRLIAHPTTADAAQAAAQAAVADRLDGRSVVVVTGTNEQAAAIATSVRDQLIELGLAEPGGVLLGRDGCTVGVGDIIAARRNDHGLGVTNRAQYKVTAIGDDGSLTVVPVDRDSPATTATDGGTAIVLPAEYVAADVQLGYASTAHAAQGLTVDAAHLVTDGDLDASGLYVGLTRGRTRNTAHVGLDARPDRVSAPAASTPGGQVRLEADLSRSSARSVLEGCLERDSSSRAATVEAELDAERLSSLKVLAGRQEALVRAACRERLDRHLDRLTADGVLDADTRARLGADEGTEHLSRLMRATEQSGADPYETLRDAISTRGLADADSPAQVLSHRITGGRPLTHPACDARVPADIAPQAQQHLAALGTRISEREHLLGERAAEDPPAWALAALGPVPADEARRQEWAAKAGTVAAHREATGWDHPDQAIGTMPGLSSTERRASYAAAWDALGQPETGLDETAMTEGQLRIRVRAAQCELDWASPHADAALRAAETAAESARQAAAIERARAEQAAELGDLEAAQKHAAEAETHEGLAALKAAAIEPLSQAATARSAWAAATALTLDQGERSTAELQRRGITIGQEPDRTHTDDWLAEQRRADQAEDEHRPVTEADLHDSATAETVADDAAVAELDRLPEIPVPESEMVADEQPVVERREATEQGRGWGRAPSAAHRVLPEDVTSGEIEAAAAAAALALSKAQDRASQDAASVDPADLDDAAGHESDEAGRRRREAADEHTATRDRSDDSGYDDSAHDA